MNFIKKVWVKLKTPHPLLLILFYILFALTLAGTIVLVVLKQDQTVWHFILYVISAIGLTYFIYTIVYLAPKIKQKIIENLKKHKFTNSMLSNYGYRTIIFSIFSMILNVAYVTFVGVLAIMTKSAWYISITAYYLVLILMKSLVIYSKYTERKNKKIENISTHNEIIVSNNGFDSTKQAAKTYRFCGIMFLFLTIALSGIIVLIYTSNMYFEYAGLLIYAVAAFTFYKLGFSIYNILKARKQDDLYVQSIRNVNLASALVSIIVLQVALFQAFSPSLNTSVANGLTAGAISLVILALGIFMIVKSNLIIKQKEKENGK